MDESMERLVEMLGYKQDPLYSTVLRPVLEDVTIDTLDKVQSNKDKVVKGLFEESKSQRIPYPSFNDLINRGIIEKVNGGFRTLEPFIVENGMESPTVSIGSELVHFGKDVTVRRSLFDAQTYLDNGSTIQYSTFPENPGTNFVGPKSIVSEAIIRRCLISGNENGKENGTYVHPLMLLDTIVGDGAQISYGTVSLSHPLHDGNAPFVDLINYGTFDTKRRRNNLSFIGSQRKIGDEVRRTKVGSDVVLNNPCAIGSGYVVKNGTDFYGIAFLEEKAGSIIPVHKEPKYGLDPMPFCSNSK